MRFHEMTWPLLRQVPRDRVVVVAPIAACEQHSRHMPVYTDTILVTGVAEGVEKRLPEQVLLLPTLWLGASHHHLPFGATLSVDVETHVRILAGYIQPLLDDVHVQQTEESTAESEPHRLGAFRFEVQRRIVELELVERFAQGRVVLGVDREQAGEDARLDMLEAG